MTRGDHPAYPPKLIGFEERVASAPPQVILASSPTETATTDEAEIIVKRRDRYFSTIYGAQISLTALGLVAVLTLISASFSAACRPYTALTVYLLRWSYYYLCICLPVTLPSTFYFAVYDDLPRYFSPIKIENLKAAVIYVFLVIVFFEMCFGGLAIGYAVAGADQLSLACQDNDTHLIWKSPDLNPFLIVSRARLFSWAPSAFPAPFPAP
jgi:hypothetical protein